MAGQSGELRSSSAVGRPCGFGRSRLYSAMAGATFNATANGASQIALAKPSSGKEGDPLGWAPSLTGNTEDVAHCRTCSRGTHAATPAQAVSMSLPFWVTRSRYSRP